MLKRLLFACLTLLFFISVPCESFAAPRKESRKERRERKKKRKNDKVQRPVKQKIRTIRHRIETAPENLISAKDKPILLEVFDDIVQTPMGRYTFEKAHPDLTFRVKPTGEGVNGSYSYRARCVNLGRRIFEDIHKATTPEKRFYEKLYIAHVIAHETTHSIQHSNNMNNRSNMSVEEAVTIHKLLELNAILNQTIVRYQIGNLPEYRHMIPDKPYASEAEAEP